MLAFLLATAAALEFREHLGFPTGVDASDFASAAPLYAVVYKQREKDHDWPFRLAVACLDGTEDCGVMMRWVHYVRFFRMREDAFAWANYTFSTHRGLIALRELD
jgi:hypothetical protein